MRYKVTLSYDGSAFFGFQRQTKLTTVQKTLEEALSIILKESITIKGAGRTDAKVHAVNQVIHFDTIREIPANSLKEVLNKRCYPHIYIKEVELVSNEFHARLSAKRKEYRYYLSINEYDPIKYPYICYYNKKLDLQKLNQAVNYLIGTHDFISLSKGHDKENTIRTIYEFAITEKDGIYEFKIIGDGFLRNMVRIIIALLLKINEEKLNLEDIPKILEAKNRKLVPFTASPNGLYLYKIYY